MSSRPARLEPHFVEKIWGATELEPWFPNSSRRIGEVRYAAGEILVKFIFTTDRLSVQVHPDDEQARAAGLGNGKTEMWHVLRAGTRACLGLGFRQAVSRSRIRETALTGEIEQLIDWKPARAGETYFVPANTVHAIGPDLVICEIQQNSDTTYRLYDYGRPRELHLEQGVAVSNGEPHPGATTPTVIPGALRLAACDYFVTDLLEFSGPANYGRVAEVCHLLAIIQGSGAIAGQPFEAGHLWRAPAGARFAIEPAGSAQIIRTIPG